MRAARDHWERWWFAPVQPNNLGLCRILFYGLLFLLYANVSWTEWADVSRLFWYPISLFRHGHIPVVGASMLTVLGLLWKLSLITTALGVFTRASSVVAFGIGWYLLGLPHNFGKTHHFDALVVILLGILMFARVGDAYSVNRRRQRIRAAPEVSGEYRWPVRAAWVMMSLVFCSAGLAKLRHGGLGWMFSDNMQVVLLQHGYQMANEDPPVRLGLWLAQYPVLCKLLATITVIIEAGYPLALVSRPARWFFPLAMCGALVGIRLTMGPTFPQFVVCHLFWIPWDRVALWLRQRRAVNLAPSA